VQIHIMLCTHTCTYIASVSSMSMIDVGENERDEREREG